ncbi:TPA: hypothetical protein ACTYSD_002569 [Klebsiella michiganensis]
MKNEIEFKFGDYAIIEQKRHGVPNEMFVHKVVGQLRSNTWVDVPVRVPATETLHGEMEDICLCICCGIDETEVRRYRVKDMRRHSLVSLVADGKRGSTITLQAVNELIQSLAKAYQQLAAENVAMKAAISAVNRTAEECELNGDELKYAVEPSEFEALTDLLDETPATDRIVAGIKADAAAPLVSALKVIANSEQHNGDTVVCDFDTLISVAAGALRDYYAKQLREVADK